MIQKGDIVLFHDDTLEPPTKEPVIVRDVFKSNAEGGYSVNVDYVKPDCPCCGRPQPSIKGGWSINWFRKAQIS